MNFRQKTKKAEFSKALIILIMLPNMVENLFPLPDRPELSLWYRTWGNSSGIPVLFVHGGPGACVADYQDINVKFFNPTIYFVVEIDQRGTCVLKMLFELP